MKGLSQDSKDLSSVNRNELLSVKKVIDLLYSDVI